MGTKLTSKYSGKCKECDTPYKSGDQIFYDKAKRIACISEMCFKDQGGEITPFQRNRAYDISNTIQSTPKQFTSKYDRPIQASIPDVKISIGIETSSKKLLEFLKAADTLARKVYPDEDTSSQQFGQIRSKLVDQLIALSKK